MSQTESKIKLIFEGAERGVGTAAAKAKAAIKSVTDEEKKLKNLQKAGDKAGDALMGIGKGLLAVSAAGSATTVIGGVAAAAAQASGALLLIPGALAAIKIGFGAIEMGAGDFLESMGNLNDNKAFAKNMKAMGDSAKGVAGQIKIAHDSLAEGLGEKMFAGIEAKLKPLIASTLPQLKASYDGIAVSVNRTGHELLDFLNQSNRQADLNKLIKDSGSIWDQLLKSVVPVGAAFLDIAVVGSQALKEMTAGLGGAAQRFADFIAKARETGQIRKWIDSGVQAFKDLWHIVENVGSTIGSVFRGLGVSMGSPLGMLRDLTERMAEFMKSTEAQEGLRELGQALKAIGLGVKDFLIDALRVATPLVGGLLKVMSENPGAVREVTTLILGAAVAIKGLKVALEVKGWVDGAIGALKAFGGASAAAAAEGGKGAGIAWGKGFTGGLALAGAGIGGTIILDKVLPADAAKTHGSQIARDMLHEMATVFQGGGSAFQTLDVAQWISNPISMAVEVGKRKLMELFGFKPPPIGVDANTDPAKGKVDDWVGGVSRARGTAQLDADASRGNNVLGGWKGSANATVGTAALNANPGQANSARAGWQSAANGTVGTARLNANAGGANAALGGWRGSANATVGTAQLHANTGAAVQAVSAWQRWANTVRATVTAVLQKIGFAQGGPVPGKAAGGPISGPGSGTSDSAGMFALSAGEWVMTAKQVANAGGFAGMARLSAALEKGRPLGLAGGGSPMRASARAAMRPVASSSAGSSGGGTFQLVVGPGADAAAGAFIASLVRTGKLQLKAA